MDIPILLGPHPSGCHPELCSHRALEAAELLHLELAVENGTGAQALARPLTWQVEYPGQDPEAQKDKLVWEVQVSERDMRVLVPLVQVGAPIPHPTPPSHGAQPHCVHRSWSFSIRPR